MADFNKQQQVEYSSTTAQSRSQPIGYQFTCIGPIISCPLAYIILALQALVSGVCSKEEDHY